MTEQQLAEPVPLSRDMAWAWLSRVIDLATACGTRTLAARSVLDPGDQLVLELFIRPRRQPDKRWLENRLSQHTQCPVMVRLYRAKHLGYATRWG